MRHGRKGEYSVLKLLATSQNQANFELSFSPIKTIMPAEPAMPNEPNRSAPPLSYDRPPSPSHHPCDSTASPSYKVEQQEEKAPLAVEKDSPALPANPPPTPETPSLRHTVALPDNSKHYVGGLELPLSPPPSPPPPDARSTQSSTYFRFSEKIMMSKRQAASVHGKQIN